LRDPKKNKRPLRKSRRTPPVVINKAQSTSSPKEGKLVQNKKILERGLSKRMKKKIEVVN